MFKYKIFYYILRDLMKYIMIYWSRFGNGEKVVNYISNKLNEKNIETNIFKTNDADPKNLPDADLYIFSTPTEAFNIQRNMRNFIKKIEGMDGKKFGIINTHAMNRNWLNKLEKLLIKKNMKMVAGIDFRIGERSQTGDGLLNGWESRADEFIEKLK